MNLTTIECCILFTYLKEIVENTDSRLLGGLEEIYFRLKGSLQFLSKIEKLPEWFSM